MLRTSVVVFLAALVGALTASAVLIGFRLPAAPAPVQAAPATSRAAANPAPPPADDLTSVVAELQERLRATANAPEASPYPAAAPAPLPTEPEPDPAIALAQARQHQQRLSQSVNSSPRDVAAEEVLLDFLDNSGGDREPLQVLDATCTGSLCRIEVQAGVGPDPIGALLGGPGLGGELMALPNPEDPDCTVIFVARHGGELPD